MKIKGFPAVIFFILLPLTVAGQIDFNKRIRVQFTGNTSFGDNVLMPLVKSRLDNVPDPQLMKADCDRIRQFYSDQGYLGAYCRYDITEYGPSNLKTLHITIIEGELYRFGEVRFEGNAAVKTRFLREIVRFAQGDPFSKNAILETHSNLMNTGLFSDVAVKNGQLDDSNNRINVTIHVQEKKRFFTDFGTGYDSEDSWHNFITWGNRNIDGKGKRVNLTALHAIDYKDDFYFKKGEISLSYLDFVFLRPKLRQTAGLHYITDKPKSANFGIEKIGVSVGVNYEKSVVSSWYLQFLYDWINLFSVDMSRASRSFRDLVDVEQNPGVQIGYQRDSRNDYIDPTAGSDFKINLLYKPGFQARVQEFWQMSAGMSLYKLLFDRLVLANQSTGGALLRTRPSQGLPSYLRYYLGGSASLRGFSQSSVGPENPDGTAQGGHFIFLNNFELRYYHSYSFNFVLLFDTGNLWLDSGMIKLATLKNTAGIGIRYRSRFGLFRLDYAVPLNTDGSGRFHVGFGQAF